MGFQAKQVPHTSHRRIFVLIWIVRQQLVRDQTAIWPLANNVSESAPSINPKLPHVSRR
jgi:hypothetical protein